jgi:hypothetical protein
MNILKLEKQIAVLKNLVEGTSLRSTERITGVHRDTIMHLVIRAGHIAREMTFKTLPARSWGLL